MAEAGRHLRLAPRSIRGLTLAVAAATAIVTAALGGLTYHVVHEEIERQIDHRIKIETRALIEYERAHGFDALLTAIRIREETGTQEMRSIPDGNGADSGHTLGYMVFDAAGARRGGELDATQPPLGWSEFVHFARPDGSRGIAQAVNSPLPDGGRLVVAVDRLIVDQMDARLFRLFGGAFGALLLFNVGATLAFGRLIRRRFEQMGSTAASIMAGDMTQRMRIGRDDSELDELATVLNAMLDRIAALVTNLRDVSSGLAHDLRTPLARMRASLDRAERIATTPEQVRELESATSELDALLNLFAGILAVAEVDARGIRNSFKVVDLAAAIDEIVEVHRAAFDDRGIALNLHVAPSEVMGDKALLQRAVGNLLDNVLVHGGRATAVSVIVGADDKEHWIEVADNGIGIPPEEGKRIFERLVRLDQSRSKPGHGLGLSMVMAIAEAHGGRVMARPSPTGLAIRIHLPSMHTG